MDGPAHDVLAGYESAMFTGDRAKGLQRGARTKLNFDAGKSPVRQPIGITFSRPRALSR